MTKTELQSALAEATQTDKRIAGVFLDTLSALAYKEIKKNGEFVALEKIARSATLVVGSNIGLLPISGPSAKLVMTS
jgi:hypothetical protein